MNYKFLHFSPEISTNMLYFFISKNVSDGLVAHHCEVQLITFSSLGTDHMYIYVTKMQNSVSGE